MTPNTLIARLGTLASLPEICLRVQTLADQPNATAAQLAEVIRHDPALAARLLRLVNSAHFGRGAPIDDLIAAVRWCGMDALRLLALGAGMLDVFKGLPRALVDMDTYWTASVHCALLARVLAGLAPAGHPERLFAAGLLHAIGQLAMYTAAPELSQQVLNRMGSQDFLRADLETEVFGCHYAAVGAALLAHWRLPTSLVGPVGHHLAPLAAQPIFAQDAALLHIAWVVTTGVEAELKKIPARAALPTIAPAIWLASGVTPEVLPQACASVDAQWFEVLEILSPGATLVF